MAFEMGDGVLKMPGIETTTSFGTCSDVNDVVKVCEEQLGEFFEKSARRGISRRLKARMEEVDKNKQFENCLLHRQELTLREYTAWCEHKQSVARKIAVCYRYIVDSVEHTIPEHDLTSAIQKLEDCMRHERTTMGMVTGAEDDKNPDDDTRSDDREFSKPYYDWHNYGDSWDKDVSSDEEEDTYDEAFFSTEDYEAPHREEKKETRDDKSEADDDDGYPGPWSYAGLDNTYYYPRREKGLGNDTSVQNHTAVAKEQSKPPTKPAAVKEASTKKAAQATTSKPPKK